MQPHGDAVHDDFTILVLFDERYPSAFSTELRRVCEELREGKRVTPTRRDKIAKNLSEYFGSTTGELLPPDDDPSIPVDPFPPGVDYFDLITNKGCILCSRLRHAFEPLRIGYAVVPMNKEIWVYASEDTYMSCIRRMFSGSDIDGIAKILVPCDTPGFALLSGKKHSQPTPPSEGCQCSKTGSGSSALVALLASITRRQELEQLAGPDFVRYMQETYGYNPGNKTLHLTAQILNDSVVLEYFVHTGSQVMLDGHVIEHLRNRGIDAFDPVQSRTMIDDEQLFNDEKAMVSEIRLSPKNPNGTLEVFVIPCHHFLVGIEFEDDVSPFRLQVGNESVKVTRQDMNRFFFPTFGGLVVFTMIQLWCEISGKRSSITLRYRQHPLSEWLKHDTNVASTTVSVGDENNSTIIIEGGLARFCNASGVRPGGASDCPINTKISA